MNKREEFINKANDWVNKYDDKIEEIKQKFKEIDRYVIDVKEGMNLIIDGIKVNLRIKYILDKVKDEYKTSFLLVLYDHYIMDPENYADEPISIISNDCHKYEHKTVEELYETIEKLKKAKYNKMTGVFCLDETLTLCDIILSMFDEDKCSVCMDPVGVCETLNCGCYCCRQCRHKMLRRGNKKCPTCRERNIEWSCRLETSESDDDT